MYLGRNCEIKTVVDPKIIKIRWAEATRPIRTINHVLMIPSRSARVLLALALYIGIGTGAVQGQKLLDFTKRLFFQSDPMGTGVTYGKLREPVFPVQRSPLELTIQSIQAISVGAQRSFVVDVLLRNTGETPYMVPASLDPERKPLLRGNRGRRMLLFQAVFVLSDTQIVHAAGIADGSDSYPNSLIQLGTQESLIVRFQIDPRQVSTLSESGVTAVNLHTSAFETKLEDDTDVVVEYSRLITSQNTVQLPLR